MSAQTYKKLLLKKLVLGLSFGLMLSANASLFSTTSVQANQGDSDAQFTLGLMYAEGDGVKQNYAKSIEWYQKAANQGNSDAQFNLGLLYADGEGVKQDYVKSAEWYQKAANQGDSDAQYIIGTLYDTGTGVKQNYAKAVEWYQRLLTKVIVMLNLTLV
ncbi:tetratricopeptide repeat protein [Psychrobacter faecalis]|uniref:tetratricopeptide repeat protein n=1 Tax=Psychrobacter faecalis TaxID=180588 RepID=UPI0022343A37|nr:tetratricopeptide repeat protein [Psychrobacter faecalis]